MDMARVLPASDRPRFASGAADTGFVGRYGIVLLVAMLAAMALGASSADASTCVSPAAYPGDDAPKEKIAAWMAVGAGARGIPGELPVMAALVESGMENLDYGDADSLGYFQMR